MPSKKGKRVAEEDRDDGVGTDDDQEPAEPPPEKKAAAKSKKSAWGGKVTQAAEAMGEVFVVKTMGGPRSETRVFLAVDAEAMAAKEKAALKAENAARRKKGEPSIKIDEGRIAEMMRGTAQIRIPRSYKDDRVRQILRWISECLLAIYTPAKAREIQCYFEDQEKKLYISSNMDNVNIDLAQFKNRLLQHIADEWKTIAKPTERQERHYDKLLGRLEESEYVEQDPVYAAIRAGDVEVMSRAKDIELAESGGKSGKAKDGFHAERRIQAELGVQLDANYLAGVKRPCLVCLVALGLVGRLFPGPAWVSAASTQDMPPEKLLQELKDHVDSCGGDPIDILSHVTQTRPDGEGRVVLTTGMNTESDSDAPPRPKAKPAAVRKGQQGLDGPPMPKKKAAAKKSSKREAEAEVGSPKSKSKAKSSKKKDDDEY